MGKSKVRFGPISTARQGSSVPNKLLAALPAEDFAALEPHLEIVSLPKGHILYDSGEAIRHAYFPHDCIVSLLAMMEDGGSAEVAIFGCEGVLGLASSLVSRESFGRYVVQLLGMASRIGIDRVEEALAPQPAVRDLLRRYFKVLLKHALQSIAC